MPRAQVQELPYNEEAEISVLGAMIASGEAAVKAIENARPDFFYKRGNRLIFEAARELYKNGNDIEVVAIADKLKVENNLDAAGGMSYLGKLIDAVSNGSNIDQHIGILRDKYIRRRIIRHVNDIEEDALGSSEDTSTLMAKFEEGLFNISDDVSHDGPVSIQSVLKETMADIEERIESDDSITGVHTGFTKLDNNTGGLKSSELTIVAGRPSMGKTAFALNVATNAALGHDTPVAIFSLEMSRREIMRRMIAAKSRVNVMKLQNGDLNERELQRISENAKLLNQSPIWIDDSPDMSVLDLRAKARRIKKEHDIGLFIVDYLQLMRTDDSVGNRTVQIGAISRGTKIASKELATPFMMLSQLSRAPEQRQDKRPRLSDLRESGDIEQDADIVLFVYRPELYYGQVGPDGEDLTGKSQILIRKQRNGPIGDVDLRFEKEFTLFKED